MKTAIVMMVFYYITQAVILSESAIHISWVVIILLVAIKLIPFAEYKQTALLTDTTYTFENPKVRNLVVLTVLTMMIAPLYDSFMGKASIIESMSMNQILMVVLFSPIMEEIIYRELLYGQALMPKLGKRPAMILVGTLFILTHGVTSIPMFIIYAIPTLLFYLIYDLTGYNLRIVIVIHIMNNYMAII